MVPKSGFHGVWKTRIRSLKSCYDNGRRTFDIVNVYSNGDLKVLSASLKKYNINRQTVVIMPQVFFPVDEELAKLTLRLNRVKALARKYIVSIVMLEWAVFKESRSK